MRGVVRGVNVDTQLLHRQLSVALFDRRARRDAGPLRAVRLRRRGRAVDAAAAEDRRCAATATTCSRSTIAGRGRTCGSTSFPTAASRGCASTARSRSTGRRVARGGRAVDLAAIEHGGLVLGASDMHFGAQDNMIMPGRAENMGDGWETRRRRGPARLGDRPARRAGRSRRRSRSTPITSRATIPDSASIEGCLAPGAPLEALAAARWSELLPQTKLRAASSASVSRRSSRTGGPVSHVRLNIFPDGGVSRLRVYGTVAPA